MSLAVVILAAGEGTRMKSRKPKVLHDLGGAPLLAHVLATARALKPDRIIIVHGNSAEEVRAAFPGPDLIWRLQSERRGTGHALMQGLPSVDADDDVLVLYGDVPLIRPKTLRSLLSLSGGSRLAVLTTRVPDPTGYGRIARNDAGELLRIVEERDASAEEKKLTEINTGIFTAKAKDFSRWLELVRPDNAKNEYYLTDCVALAVSDGVAVAGLFCQEHDEVLGVNDRAQLAHAERLLQKRRAMDVMAQGATLKDPARIDIRGEVTVASDVEIDINVVFSGSVELGEGVKIGPNSIIKNAKIASGTEVFANSLIEDADIGKNCRIGPFARIRPGTELADEAHIGNFVEIKKSRVGEKSKINHLSYVGDTTVGKRVNIGAGTITCNYDGANKHQTIIGDDAFIGSDTQLIAPVTIGDGATIGAGSTITKDAPAQQLTLSRSPQQSMKTWRRPQKKHRE